MRTCSTGWPTLLGTLAAFVMLAANAQYPPTSLVVEPLSLPVPEAEVAYYCLVRDPPDTPPGQLTILAILDLGEQTQLWMYDPLEDRAEAVYQAADLTGDAVVDADDLETISSLYATQSCGARNPPQCESGYQAKADYDRDGRIDAHDLVLFVRGYVYAVSVPRVGGWVMVIEDSRERLTELFMGLTAVCLKYGPEPAGG